MNDFSVLMRQVRQAHFYNFRIVLLSLPPAKLTRAAGLFLLSSNWKTFCDDGKAGSLGLHHQSSLSGYYNWRGECVGSCCEDHHQYLSLLCFLLLTPIALYQEHSNKY